MAGYLGKISAIVTANTADFQSKLSAAAKDVQKFASSMQGALSSAQTKSATSLRGIYIEAQKVDRALQAVSTRKLAFKGFQGKDLEEAVGRMKALFSTTQQISGPLATSAKSFEKLSAEVQSQFLPSLISAQKATEALADTINRTGTVSEERFQAVAKKVALVREAIGRLTEASAAVAKLEGGAGLRFSSPRQFDAFSAAAEQQQRASGLSAQAAARLGLGPQQQAISEQSRTIEALMARRERLKSRGQDTSQVDAGISRETDRLEALVRVYGRLIDAAMKYELRAKGGFVSRDSLVNSAKGINRGAFVPLEDLQRSARAAKDLEIGLRKVEAASRFGTSFGKFLDQAAVGKAQGQLAALQNVLLKVGATASGPLAAAYERLRLTALKAAEDQKLGSASVQAQITKQTQEVIRLAAATGKISVASATRMVARGGDVGRFGVDKFSLALNQAAFAVDDFFSSTGGLEFKLRAVSNNITQLGFVLGGTTGLFISLAAVIGGQVAVAIGKYAFGLEDAKKKEALLKAASEELNSSLDKQKGIVESLASSYRNLASEIKQATLTPKEARFEERKDRVAELRQQQADARREAVAQIVPTVAAARARRKLLEEEAAKEPDQIKQVALQRRIQNQRNIENAAFGEIDAAAGRRIGQNRGQLQERADFFNARLRSLGTERDKRVARGLPTEGIDRDIAAAAKQFAEFSLAIQRVKDEAAATSAELTGGFQASIQDAQQRLSQVATEDQSVAKQVAAAQETLNQAGRSLASIMGRAASGEMTPAQVQREVSGVQRFARGGIEASNSLGPLADTLTKDQKEREKQDEERNKAIERGRELTLTPGQKAAEEFNKQIADIREYADRAAKDSSGLPADIAKIRERMNEAIGRTKEEMIQQVAPTIAGMANDVQNAVLAGPSRAALNAADVTTTQGQQELNRLLRGDDPAKNADLVALQREANRLLQAIADKENPVAD
jgi:hypothetical protein